MKARDLSDSWKAWLEENASRLLLYARQRCGNMEEAEDLLQDCLVKLWHYQAAKKYCPPDLPLAFSVMRFIALDWGRKKGRMDKRNQKIVQFQLGNDQWLDVPAEEEEEAAMLREEVAGLGEKLREVITMKIWGGLTFAEIAEVLGVSQNTAASRYRYGLEQLQKKLKHLKKNG